MNNEKKTGENGSKDSGSGFPFDCDGFKGMGMFEMMRQCCDGKSQMPDCCADMGKTWDKKNDQPKGNSG